MHAFLFLEMAQQELQSDDRQSIIDLLEPDLRKDYRRSRPRTLVPSAVEKDGSAGRSVIVTGYPRFVEDRTQFSGFIMIPIMAGKVTTFMMIPIFDKFDVYEVFDDRRMRKPNSMVATVRGQRLAHDGAIRFGGVLRCHLKSHLFPRASRIASSPSLEQNWRRLLEFLPPV